MMTGEIQDKEDYRMSVVYSVAYQLGRIKGIADNVPEFERKKIHEAVDEILKILTPKELLMERREK